MISDSKILQSTFNINDSNLFEIIYFSVRVFLVSSTRFTKSKNYQLTRQTAFLISPPISFFWHDQYYIMHVVSWFAGVSVNCTSRCSSECFCCWSTDAPRWRDVDRKRTIIDCTPWAPAISPWSCYCRYAGHGLQFAYLHI